MLIKAELVRQIGEIINKQNLTQIETELNINVERSTYV